MKEMIGTIETMTEERNMTGAVVTQEKMIIELMIMGLVGMTGKVINTTGGKEVAEMSMIEGTLTGGLRDPNLIQEVMIDMKVVVGVEVTPEVKSLIENLILKEAISELDLLVPEETTEKLRKQETPMWEMEDLAIVKMWLPRQPPLKRGPIDQLLPLGVSSSNVPDMAWYLLMDHQEGQGDIL